MDGGRGGKEKNDNFRMSGMRNFKGTFFEPISDLWASIIASLDFWVSLLTLSGFMGILLSVPLALTPTLPNRL